MRCVFLLVLFALAPPVHARNFVSIGADVGSRGVGAEVSIIHFKPSEPWFGAVLGGQKGFLSDGTHVFAGGEIGQSFVGLEGGLALGEDGLRPRLRALLAGIFITGYVEYQPGPTPLAIGVLLKMPIQI